MKKIKFFYEFSVFFLIFFVSTTYAQQWKLKKADEYYERFDYTHAVPLYESIKNKDAEIYRKLGRAYYVMGNFEKAKKAYKKIISNGIYTPEDIYNYAYYLRVNGEYKKAIKWMRKFARLRPNDSRARRFVANPYYYKELLRFNPNVIIHNVAINGKYEDFGPAGFRDTLVVFASSRDASRNWKGNDQPFLDLYKAKIVLDTSLSDVKSFSRRINSRYHDGPATFNKNGTYMVLTRNIYNEKKITENKLWLYESYLKDGKWTEPKPLHFNSKDYSCGHPSLSADGKTMYFASDIPGGFGGLDIYVVKRINDSTWGQPKNVGAMINTEGNEMFPTWDSEQGYLFFSSDGLPGLGGMDLFVVRIEPNGDISEPVNLGAPINSTYDDFAIYYRNNESGFFSSNRPGGKGSDDLYAFVQMHNFKNKAIVYYLTGKVLDHTTGKPIAARIMITEDQKVLSEHQLAPGQNFKIRVWPGHHYKIKAFAPGYIAREIPVDIKEAQGSIYKDIQLLSVRQKELLDLCRNGIEPLYYDLDKYYLRSGDSLRLKKIVAIMKKFPGIKIEISSYTDSRATFDYNMELSKKRTMVVVKYLIDNGISIDRLKSKWYGETRLVNGCVDGVDCTEEQHQLNRRTEFKIINCDQITGRKYKMKENRSEH